MGLFKRKKDRVVDWSDKLKRQEERREGFSSNTENSESYADYSNTSNSSSSENAPFPFFAQNNTSTNQDSYGASNSDVATTNTEERKKRLGKRLLDMTTKIEDLSNQVYKLQQRIEVLERRNSTGY